MSVVKSLQSQYSTLVMNVRVFPSGISTDIYLCLRTIKTTPSLTVSPLVLHVPDRQIQDFKSTLSGVDLPHISHI
jgi:hypothetical protein